MSEMEDYMDESFRKMSEDIQATYHASFWDDVAAQLENDSLDDAFRNAASIMPAFASFETVASGVEDAFMDDAFREGAGQISAAYNASFWQSLQQTLPNLEMDVAFSDAANQVIANYNPSFWGEANSALENEGLHFEYQSEYWNEARLLLDRADRSVFFTKWTAAAILFLLISFIGLNTNFEKNLVRERPILPSNKSVVVFASEQQSAVDNQVNINANSDLQQARIDASHDFNSTTVTRTFQNSSSQKTRELEVAEALLPPAPIDPFGMEPISFGESLQKNPENVIDSEENELVNGLSGLNFFESQQEDAELDLNSARNGLRNMPVHFIPINKTFIEVIHDKNLITTPDGIELTAQILKPLHTIALTGHVGLGQNYGPNTYFFTKRYGGGVEYCFAGSGRLKNGHYNRFEFGAGVGLNYVQADGLGIENQVTLFKTNGEYEKYWRNLQIFDLFYGNFNVYSNFRVNARHKFKLGVGIDRLLAVQSNMAYRMDDDKGIQTVNNNWGVQDGIAKFDLTYSLGYDFVVNHKWTLQLNFTAGLLDRTDKTFFYNQSKQNFERNLTVGLRYTIFNKL